MVINSIEEKKEHLLTEYSNKSISKNILNSKDINF